MKNIFVIPFVLFLSGCATEYHCVANCVETETKKVFINPGVEAARERGRADATALKQAYAEFKAYCDENPYGRDCKNTFINQWNAGWYQPPGGYPVNRSQSWSIGPANGKVFRDDWGVPPPVVHAPPSVPWTP